MAGNPLHVLSSTALGLSSAGKETPASPEYAIDTEPGLDDFLSEHVAVFNEDWGENWKHECRENLRKIVLATEPPLRPLTEPIMWTLLNMSGNENARKAHEGWVHFNIVPVWFKYLERMELRGTCMRLLCIMAVTFFNDPETFFFFAEHLYKMKGHLGTLWKLEIEMLFQAACFEYKQHARELKALGAASMITVPVAESKYRPWSFSADSYCIRHRADRRIQRMRRYDGVPSDFPLFLKVVFHHLKEPLDFEPIDIPSVDDVLRLACHLPVEHCRVPSPRLLHDDEGPPAKKQRT